jgi:hypothetical protein
LLPRKSNWEAHGKQASRFFRRRAQGFATLPLTALNFFSETIPRNGAITFGDLIGKLDVLHVACDKCGRKGRYAVASLVRYRMVAFRQ